MKEQITQIREALKVELGELAWADRYPTDNEKQRAGSLRAALATLDKLEAQPQPPAKVDVATIMAIFENGSGTWNSVASKQWCREQLTKILTTK